MQRLLIFVAHNMKTNSVLPETWRKTPSIPINIYSQCSQCDLLYSACKCVATTSTDELTDLHNAPCDCLFELSDTCFHDVDAENLHLTHEYRRLDKDCARQFERKFFRKEYLHRLRQSQIAKRRVVRNLMLEFDK